MYVCMYDKIIYSFDPKCLKMVLQWRDTVLLKSITGLED